MYIALKWLVSMVLTMWVALCSFDVHWKKSLIKPLEYDLQNPFTHLHNDTKFEVQQNSYEIEKLTIPNKYSNGKIYLQYLIFLAGICIAAIFKRKNDIILCTKNTIINFYLDKMNELLRKLIILKKPAQSLGAAIILKFKIIFMRLFETNDLNLTILFNKLKELNQKRRDKSGQENNFSSIYRLESEIANELAQNEFPKRQVIGNQTRSLTFQQLYLVTHQENILLKSRLKKLIKEKEDAERKLIKLINQVCQSKNNDLKAYCSQLIVHTKTNLLNSDVKAEIDKFLRKSCSIQAHNLSSDQSIKDVTADKFIINPNKMIASENQIIVQDNAPKFMRVSGEYVWTVKDKDGIIEKLYEYGSDFDKGDMVKRIRQYSVYYDTECLLDFSNSTTFLQNQHADISKIQNEFTNIKVTVTNRRFLSNSQAFKNFLQNNKSMVAQSSRPSNAILSI